MSSILQGYIGNTKLSLEVKHNFIEAKFPQIAEVSLKENLMQIYKRFTSSWEIIITIILLTTAAAAVVTSVGKSC